MEFIDQIRKTVRRFQEEIMMDDWYQEVSIDHGDQGYLKIHDSGKVTKLEQPDCLFYTVCSKMILAVDKRSDKSDKKTKSDTSPEKE